jgi:quercetin dioxygenase-like cupin family protein
MTNRHTHVAFAAFAGSILSIAIVPAGATPGSGFAPSPIVNGHFGTLDAKTESDKTGHWVMILKTKDDTDVGSDRLTVQPGGFSGWHSHPAPVFVTVTQGSIVWYDGSNPTCPGHTYHVGDSFDEQAYRVHNVRNASNSAPAEFIAIRINPTGVGFRLDETKPTNCS